MSKAEIRRAISHFSKKEYSIFLAFVALLILSTLIMLNRVNSYFMVSVPLQGGSITEGTIGTPRFINPVLAFSNTDQDLVSLIYSGLMRKNSDGTLVPDLAKSYEVSKDGLTYTFTLKDKIFFHNNEPITPDDIIFTISKIKDPTINSPKSGNWDGVKVEKIDDKTIRFTLRQPYSSFLENTTLGIMPQSVWKDTPIELNDANINPIGSGPFKVSAVNKKSGGLIDYYDLVPFKRFDLGKAYINDLKLRFYPNEDTLLSALQRGEVDQIASITPANAETLKEEGYRIESVTLPRVFGLFFNQNQNRIFTDKNVVKAIDLAIDKKSIVHDVLLDYGVTLDGPIPPNMTSSQELSDVSSDSPTQEERTKQAQDILNKDGWVKDTDGFLHKTTTEKKKKKTTADLTFTISTGNSPELVKSADIIKQNLEAIGMKVEVKSYEIGNLNQGVIRPRKFDALLFGQIINHESDLFAFWHSSQRKDPGLNVAMYTNSKVDKILEDAFITTDEKARIKKYSQFEDEIKKDMPAVFLYSPDFIYVVSKNLQGFKLDHVTNPSDRFLNSYLWYTDTDNVWKIFSK